MMRNILKGTAAIVIAVTFGMMMAPQAASAAANGPDIGIMATSCRVDYDTLTCTTAAAAASGGEIDIAILKPVAAVPCNYYVTDANNGRRVREGTFWYGNAFYDTLTGVYSSYRLTIWGCSPLSEGYIG